MKEETDSNPHFTEPYYRARKSISLYSGLLLAYELIGFEIGEQPFSSFNIKILSPLGIPIVLIALILFYGFRYILEWQLCTEESRSNKYSKWDYRVTIGIASISVSVFLIQRILESQILSSYSNVLVGILTGAIFKISLDLINRLKRRNRIQVWHSAVLKSVMAVLIFIGVPFYNLISKMILGIFK